jgi:DNA-binding transcriptional LysR family regulator
MDRFADLQIFVRVAESGSISAAAAKLEIAKSAVSRRLAELEGRLGVQLLHRTTRRLSLTDSGSAFLERAQRILADLDEAEAAVSQAHGALKGRLRVALPLSFGLLHLSQPLQAFMALHPGVEFDLDFNDRRIDLMQDGFDLAIRIANLPDSTLIARRLTKINHCVCASPDYLKRHGTPMRAEELSQHVCLAYSNLANPGLWQYHTPDGAPGSVQVPVKLKANNGEFLCQAAQAGHGLILHPTFYLGDALRNGSLVSVLGDHAWPELNAYAVYPPTRHLSSRVRALVDFLANHFAGTASWER